jgi:hypothetical protein
MTDRIKGLVITLDHDYRTDDVDAIVNAIMMVKGVANVSKSVADMDDHMNRARIVYKLRQNVLDLFDENNLKLT